MTYGRPHTLEKYGLNLCLCHLRRAFCWAYRHKLTGTKPLGEKELIFINALKSCHQYILLIRRGKFLFRLCYTVGILRLPQHFRRTGSSSCNMLSISQVRIRPEYIYWKIRGSFWARECYRHTVLDIEGFFTI